MCNKPKLANGGGPLLSSLANSLRPFSAELKLHEEESFCQCIALDEEADKGPNHITEGQLFIQRLLAQGLQRTLAPDQQEHAVENPKLF